MLSLALPHSSHADAKPTTAPWSTLLAQASPLNRGLVTAIAVISVGLIHWIDVITGDVSVSALYLLPICLCTWVVGRRTGLAMAVACAIADLHADLVTREDIDGFMKARDSLFTSYWNAAVLFSLFVFVVLLFYSLRQSNLRLDSKVAQRTAELTAANEELCTTQNRLIESAKLETIGRLAAGVAHEVKNPLMTISMASEFLSGIIPANDPDAKVVVQDMRDAINRANRVISELLELSRPADLHFEPEDLHAVLEQTLGIVRMEANRKQIRISRQFPVSSPIMALDRNKIIQVFVNLATNAVQAMRPGGTLTVAVVHELDGTVQVLFEDNGPGVKPADLPKLFEPFFTTKHGSEGGTGLGLSVSRRIVEQHKGTLTLANRPQGGVVATVTFPPVTNE